MKRHPPSPPSRSVSRAFEALLWLTVLVIASAPCARAAENPENRIPLNLDFSRPSLVDERRPWGWSFGAMDRAGVTVELAPGEGGGTALRLSRAEAGRPARARYPLGTLGAGRKMAVEGRIAPESAAGAEVRLGLELSSSSTGRLEVWAAPACALGNAPKPVPCRVEAEVPADAESVAVVLELDGSGAATVGPLTLRLDGEPVGNVLPGQEPPPPEVVAAARERAIPLRSVDPAAALDELAALDPVLEDATLVLLGESTHGTREFFTWKHRLVRYLAERKGFTVFVLEDHWGPARAIDRFVGGGQGPAEELVAELFQVWERQEMVDLVRWMRAASESGAARLGVWGIDLQDPRAPVGAVEEFLREHDGELAEEVSAAYSAFRAAWEEGPYPRRAPAEHQRWTDSARQVLERMEERAEEHRAAAGERPAAEALFAARLAWQSAELSRAGSPALRDRYLAENLSWIRSHHPEETRIVVWAHNAHVRGSGGSMGGYLRELHPGEVVSFGLLTYQGTYAAYRADGPEVFPLFPGPPGSVEDLLHRTGIPVLALPLDSAQDQPGRPAERLLDWLRAPRWERMIGSAPDDFGFVLQPQAGLYDALVFVDRTVAARPID